MAPGWNLQSLPIKLRLRIFFAAVVAVMLLGSILSFREFRNVSAHAKRVSRVEQRVSALLRLNNGLLSLMGRLHRAADNRDPVFFDTESRRVLEDFKSQAAGMKAALQDIAQESDMHAVLAGSISTMLDVLPGRILSLAELAHREDWVVLHARMLNQADQTDDVLAALMQQVDTDLAVARNQLLDDLERAQKRAVNTLALIALLSLAAAALVGTLITRSITHPLSSLDAGARALAAGNFEYRIPVKGRDELAHLAQVFNSTAEKLARLFEEVRLEHDRAEAARASLQERAQELARANADLQQFAYSASHDLQEPLRTVSLYSQLLRRRYTARLDQRAEEYIDVLFRSARQMEQMITDLLAYTRAGAGNKAVEAPTEVNMVLSRVLSTLETQIRDNHCTVLADPLPSVEAHEIHVQQILQNLIGNAIKYRSEHAPEIHISATRKQEHWRFAIRDNGIGIEPQYASQVFGMFKRLHGQKYPGTGIGLAICQRIVEGYGGSIGVESELGRGATFWFTLPGPGSQTSNSIV